MAETSINPNSEALQHFRALAKSPEGMKALEILGSTYNSILTSREELMGRAGVTFGGKRSLNAVFGYQTVISYRDMAGRIRRNGIAKRVNNAYPEATWRNPPVVSDTDNNDRESPFEQAWDKFVRKFKLWSLLERLDRLSGIGRYGCLVIGAAGDMATELTKDNIGSGGTNGLLYLSPYGEGSMQISDWEAHTDNERYGLPSMYKLIPAKVKAFSVDGSVKASVNLGAAAAKPVHYSRVIHVTEGLLEGNIYGTPRLESVWNYLDDLDKITGGSGETFWLKSNPITQFEIDPTFQIVDQAKMDAQVMEIVHGFQRYIKTQGMKINTVGAQISDPRGSFMVAIQCVSGTSGIPARILMGSEAGQLASGQDRDNWNERCIERRNSYGEPFILFPVIDRMVELGALPPPAKDPTADWPNLSAYSAEMMSQMALRESVAEANHATAKTKGGALLSDDEARKRWMDRAPMSAKVKAELQKAIIPVAVPAAGNNKNGGGSGGNGGGNTPKGSDEPSQDSSVS